MPIYTYKCDFCEAITEIYQRIRETNHSVKCGNCLEWTSHKLISNTAKPSIKDYFDFGLGEKVTGERHRRRLMKEKDLIETGNEKLKELEV